MTAGGRDPGTAPISFDRLQVRVGTAVGAALILIGHLVTVVVMGVQIKEDVKSLREMVGLQLESHDHRIQQLEDKVGVLELRVQKLQTDLAIVNDRGNRKP